MKPTGNVRVRSIRPLLSPAIVLEEIPRSDRTTATVLRGRNEVEQILAARDNRLLVVVGPCSIHDPKAGLEYATKLAEIAGRERDALCILMRVYFEKPRTTVGWKGLINDPNLDGSFRINQGLRVARQFLHDVCDLGLPCGTEFLDPITPQFIADLVSWGAIGARTTESQVHRELASGSSMPIGFKNATSGSVQIAVDAVSASAAPHHFLGVTEQGLAAVIATEGNPHCHVILRGGDNGPNYDESSVADVAARLEKRGIRRGVMIDCSHANSGKDPDRQAEVVREVASQIGSRSIVGVMMESFLVSGRQDLDQGPLTYGQSVTDACMGWGMTEELLGHLAERVRADRR